MVSKRSPKYIAISREIETGLRRGQWNDGSVMSARRIAEAHRVSVVTASRALQVLRDRGLIQTVERQGSYVVPAAAVAASGEHWVLCLRVTPGPWYEASLSTTRNGFAATARRQGVFLDVSTFADAGPTSSSELAQRVRRAADAGATGVFLLPSRLSEALVREDEAILEACRAARLPVVLVERNLRGLGRPLEYDLVGTDDIDGGAICTRHLLAQERKRLAFVIGSPTSSHEGRLAGYLSTLFQSDAKGRGLEPRVFSQASDVPIKAAYQQLADRVVAEGVDGVICFQDYTAIGLILELLTRGVRVPQDVALTGFDDLPIGDSFALGVTTYAPPPETIAEEALRLMRRRVANPTAPVTKVLLPGRLIVRESSRSSPGALAVGDPLGELPVKRSR